MPPDGPAFFPEREDPMKERNRYFVLAMAAVTNFCYGCAYIWTVFQPEAKLRFGLENAAANRPLPFSC